MEDALRVRLLRVGEDARVAGIEGAESGRAQAKEQHPETDSGEDETDKHAKARHELEACFALLCEYNGEPRIAVELLVICAEAALKFDALVIAERSAELCFTRGKVRDQFYCRALFVKALIEHKSLQRGDVLSRALSASKHIDAAVDVCLDPVRKDAYSFLVYNASVIAWQVMRPIMRQGCRHHTLKLLSKLCEALNAADDPHKAWRARLGLALALAHNEVGAQAPAQAEAKRALDLVQEVDPTSEIARETNALCVHIQQQGALAAAKTARTQGDVQPILQCIRSGIIADQAGIEAELQESLKTAVAAGNQAAEDGDSQDDEMKTRNARTSIGVIGVGRAALRAHLYELSEECMSIAVRLPARVRTAVDEIDLDLFRAEWLAECPTATAEMASTGQRPLSGSKGSGAAATSEKTARAMNLAKRIQAMRLLDRCISLCLRLHQPGLLEETCLVTWNIGLPLLQPHLRTHVHKAFSSAASALEEVDSPLLELRAHLHSELAKCEMASDFLQRANDQVEKAMHLQRSSQMNQESNTENNSDLTRFLKPMQEKLRLKSSIYNEPENPLEQAILQVEQAKDAGEKHLKASLLMRAAAFLDQHHDESLEQSSREQHNHTGAAAEDKEEGAEAATQDADARAPEQIANNVTSIALWAEIAQLASTLRLLPLTERAAQHVLVSDNEEDTTELPEGVDAKSWSLQRARVHFVFADALARQLQTVPVDDLVPKVANMHVRTLGLLVPTPIENPEAIDDPLDEDSEDANRATEESRNIVSPADMAFDWLPWQDAPFPEDLPQRKDEVVKQIVAALKIGSTLCESWLVENAATYLWNFHLHVFNGPIQRFQFVTDALIDGLQEVVSALVELDPEERNDTMYCAVACALAQSLEGRALRTQMLQGQTANADDDLRRAAEVCIQTLADKSPRIAKELIATLQRVQRRRKSPQPLPDDLLARGFAVIELLRLEGGFVAPEEKQSLLESFVGQIQGQEDLLLHAADRSDQLVATEVWTRLGRQSFQIGNLDIADTICSAALRTLASHGQSQQRKAQDGEDRMTTPSAQSFQQKVQPNRVPVEFWRWYAICSCVKGQVAAARAAAITHDKTTQDMLREESLRMFRSAAEYGVRAKVGALVLDAAKELWNVATTLVGSAGTRSILFEPLRAMLQCLAAVSEKSEMALRVSMYAALFECFKDTKDWKGGLKAVDEAFRIVPQSLQKRLWAARVIFNSKLNKDVAAGLHKMKEGNKSLQAKAWMTLATSSANQEDQLQAHVQALSLLEGSYERVEYLIEFAEWLHANHFSRDDVTQCLVSAADQILDVEVAAQKRAQAAAEARAKGAMSPKSPSSLVTSNSRRSIRSASPKRNVKATRELGEPCADAPRELRLGDLLKLVQIFAMLARSVPHSKIRADMALIAHEHLSSAWTRFVAPGSKCNLLTVIGADLADATEGSEENEDAKVSRIPAAAAATIERPYLVVHYLLELGSLLQECGQDALAITCYVMMERICADVIQDRTFATLAALKTVRALSLINLGAAARSKMNEIDISLNEEERIRFGVEVEQLLQHRSMRQRARRASIESAPTDGSTESAELDEDPDAIVTKSGVQPTRRRMLGPMKIREVWARLASELVDLGYIFEGKVLLHEVALHNDAYEDKENTFRAATVAAKVALLEGKESAALARAVEAMGALNEHRGGNVNDWLHCIREIVACLRGADRSADASTLMKKALAVYNSKLQNMGTLKDLDLEVATSYVETLVAEQLFAEVKVRALQGANWRDEWVQCQKHLRNAQDRILIATKPQCASVATMDILLMHCAMWMEVYKTQAMEQEHVAFSRIVDGLSRASRCGEAMLQMVLPTSELFCTGMNEVNLPLERYVGRVQNMLGSIELLHDAFCNPLPAVSSAAREAERIEQLNPAERWLMETAPVPPPTLAELHPGAAQRACSYFMGTYKHLHHMPARAAVALVAAGQGLCRNNDARAQKVLYDGIEAALAHDDYDLAKIAAHELVLGMESAEALVLYQACRARAWMFNLLKETALDGEGKLSQFLRLQTHIEASLFSPGDLSKTAGDDASAPEKDAKVRWPYADVSKFLRESVQLQRLSCRQRVSSLLKSLPDAVEFLVLSLSENGRVLYSAHLDAESYDTERNEVRAKANKFPLAAEEAEELHSLVREISTCRKRMSSQLLSRTQDASFEDSASKLEDKASEDIEAITRRMRRLLAPAIPILRSEGEGENADAGNDATPVEDDAEPSKRLVILADPLLARLPLELLFEQEPQKEDEEDEAKTIDEEGEDQDQDEGEDQEKTQDCVASQTRMQKRYLSVSRDFSLHLFHQRMQSMVPGLQEAVAADEAFQVRLSQRPTSVRYVVDPRSEESGLRDNFTADTAWQGHVGAEMGVPSRGDWQALLASGDDTQFLFSGLGSFLAQVDPGAVAALDMRHCWSAVLIDRAVNDASYRFQSEQEASLSAAALQLKQPVETAALLSLCGVNAIVQHQWACTVHRAIEMQTRLASCMKQGATAPLLVDAMHSADDNSRKLRVKANAAFYGVPLL
ncbi:Cilia- and flagella-associated protein 46 [Hondaea fermentalgiana]|uniref:Cilia-and flagella-associated protein 46 n=1 Tax=Hondaea fermentalgiana TaxID=2315210 RepID=A0A2R5GSE7_9STRA|nr:Cilia- and flagella-associated protein 46 [Hondaea fermentalgiana]|eukprot:GBG31291.1 Cilia- and flagella-associated protein 46 [Hondaea fermentalgiana]